MTQWMKLKAAALALLKTTGAVPYVLTPGPWFFQTSGGAGKRVDQRQKHTVRAIVDGASHELASCSITVCFVRGHWEVQLDGRCVMKFAPTSDVGAAAREWAEARALELCRERAERQIEMWKKEVMK